MSAQLFTSSTLASHNAHSKMHRPSLTCQARQVPTARFGASHSQLLGSRLGSHSFAGWILPTGCCVIRHGGQELLPRSVSCGAGRQLVALPPKSRQTACGATGVQANLFSRFLRVIRSYANSVGMALHCPHLLLQLRHCVLTSTHVDPDQCCLLTVSGAEDPEKMLDQAVNEMQSDLVRLRQASAQVPHRPGFCCNPTWRTTISLQLMQFITVWYCAAF